MNKYINILIVTILLSFSTNCLSNKYERYTLKNGYEFVGYIKDMSSNGKIVIYGNEFVIRIDKKYITNFNDVDKDLSEVSNEWLKWSEENNVFLTNSNGKKIIRLSDIEFDVTGNQNDSCNKSVTDLSFLRTIYPDGLISGVRILKEDKDAYKFLVLKTCEFPYYSNCIEKIEYSLPNKDFVTGYKDIVMANGKGAIVGRIVEQIPGRNLTIQSDNGIRCNVDFKDVLYIGKEPMSPDYSIWEQIPFIDVLKTKNNKNNEGIIVKKDNKNGVWTLAGRDGKEYDILVNDISRIIKKENFDYKTIKNRDIKEGEIYIGKEKISEITVTPHKKNMFVLDENVKIININVEDRIIIESLNNDTFNKSLLIKIEKKSIKKIQCYAFDYKDIIVSQLPCTNFKTNNGNLLKEYKVSNNDKGTYLLFNPHINKGYIFSVQ